MRILPAVAAAIILAGVGAPAAQADTTQPTADLALSRLGFSVNASTVTITAVSQNLGPDRAQPAVQVTVWGGTVKSIVCTFNGQQFADSSDGDTCEIAPLTLTGRAGMILKVHVTSPAIVSASASVYDLNGATDPNSSNDSKYRQIYVH
jgi:hypothetical protein